MERAAADCDRRARHHRNGVRPRAAPRRHVRRAARGARAGDLAAAHAAGAAHHHRHSHHDVDGARAAVLRACGDEAAAPPAVSLPDVRGGGLRRADERAGRRVSAGRRVLHLPGVAEAARRSAAHDAADRRAHQPGHRRAVVLLPVSRARMGIHRVVHLRREPRTLRGSGRRTIARPAVLHPGDARRSVPVVAHDSGRALVGDSRRAAGPRRAAARRLDRGDRRVLFALGHEGGFVHPSDRAGRGRADRRHARQGHRRRADRPFDELRTGPLRGLPAQRQCCCS